MLALSMTDREFADVAGMDALNYLMFMRFCLLVSIVITVIAVGGMLPLYVVRGPLLVSFADAS